MITRSDGTQFRFKCEDTDGDSAESLAALLKVCPFLAERYIRDDTKDWLVRTSTSAPIKVANRTQFVAAFSNASPGDLIELTADINIDNSFRFDGINGTATNHITVRSEPGQCHRIYQGGGSPTAGRSVIHLEENVSYVDFIDVDIDGQATAAGGPGATWVFAMGARWTGENFADGTVHHIRLIRCYVHHGYQTWVKGGDSVYEIDHIDCTFRVTFPNGPAIGNPPAVGFSGIYYGQGYNSNQHFNEDDKSHDLRFVGCDFGDINWGRLFNIKSVNYNVTVDDCLAHDILVLANGAYAIASTNCTSYLAEGLPADANIAINRCFVWNIYGHTGETDEGSGLWIGQGKTTVTGSVVWNTNIEPVVIARDFGDASGGGNQVEFNTNTFWGNGNTGGRDDISLNVLDHANDADCGHPGVIVGSTADTITSDGSQGTTDAAATDFCGPITGTADAGINPGVYGAGLCAAGAPSPVTGSEGSGFILAETSSISDLVGALARNADSNERAIS